jgi:hypothetical protein
VDIEHNIRSRPALAFVAVVAWFGVLLQLWLSIRLALGNGKPPIDGLIAFLGYFTVLTNVFVALASSLPLTLGSTRLGRWFGTGMVLGCATTAILLVGIAYYFLLRNVWAPKGLQWVADVTLHYVVPVALFVYWVSFPPRKKLPIWAPLAWCLYPAIYLAYALARGELLDSYPYHFIDVTSLGYAKALVNSLWLAVAFVVLGSVVLGVAKLRRNSA